MTPERKTPSNIVPEDGSQVISPFDHPLVAHYTASTGPRLNGTLRAVFREIGRYVDADTGWGSPTQERIADDLDMARGTVIDAVKDLQGLGLLIAIQMQGAGGKRLEYFLTGFYSGWESAPKNKSEKSPVLAAYRLRSSEMQERIDEQAREIKRLRESANGTDSGTGPGERANVASAPGIGVGHQSGEPLGESRDPNPATEANVGSAVDIGHEHPSGESRGEAGIPEAEANVGSAVDIGEEASVGVFPHALKGPISASQESAGSTAYLEPDEARPAESPSSDDIPTSGPPDAGPEQPAKSHLERTEAGADHNGSDSSGAGDAGSPTRRATRIEDSQAVQGAPEEADDEEPVKQDNGPMRLF